MSNTPILYQLLGKLSKSELRQVKKMVRSPFITHRTDLESIFNILAKCCYQGKPLPQKEDLFREAFGEVPYDDQKMRNMMSDLHVIMEKYLMWQAVQQDEIQSHIYLAKLYRQRNLLKHFNTTVNKIEAFQRHFPYRNADYFQKILNAQLETSQFQAIDQRSGHLNLQEIGDTMDTLYLAQKLRHACSQLSHSAVYQTEYELGLLPQWIDCLDNSAYLAIPSIALYYYCYRFQTEENSQVYFRKFREQLGLYANQFPQDELKDLYRAAINYCIRKLNEGSLVFTREGWELYQEGLLAGFFIENSHLSRFTFDNIVGFGLRLEEFDRVEEFIKNYKIYLSPDYQESTVYFNLARLEYGRKQYGEALISIQQANPKDLVNQLITKTLQLKIYYEINEISLLEFHLDSFRSFIRRREVSDYHRENFQNIITFTRKLITVFPNDTTERLKLRTAIEQEKILSERDWLLSKL